MPCCVGRVGPGRLVADSLFDLILNNALAVRASQDEISAKLGNRRKRGEERATSSSAHTTGRVCTTKKLSCLQTRQNCLLKLLHGAIGSLKMR